MTVVPGRARSRWLGALLLSAALADRVDGQRPPSPPSAGPDSFARLRGVASYSGFIDWKNSSTDNDGTQTETVRVRVDSGNVSCDVGFVSPDHRAGTIGPGLLELSLELSPDPGDTIGPGGARRPAPTGKMYSLRIACPNAQYKDGIQPARWSHLMESYKQSGGDIGYDPRTAQPTFPELKGTWTELFNDPNGGNSSSTLAWHLCAGGCRQPPQPRLPPPESEPGRLGSNKP